MDIVVRYIPNNTGYLAKCWELSEPIEYLLSDGNTIVIDKGFRFDMASVPRILWSLFPPYGDFLPAAVVHDWLYIHRYKANEMGRTKARLFADNEMLKISNKFNSNKIDNYIRYFAVRLFGGLVYKK